jgi:plastocyanin
VSVGGRVTVLEGEGRLAQDVGDAVVWLVPARVDTIHAVEPRSVSIQTSDKEFRPHVVVVPAGSRVAFPNSDPFDHNVFSRTPEGAFDLGRYGRGRTRSTTLPQAGIIRVYCNIHAHMSAIVVVRDNPYYARPLADGSFTIRGVPPGTYTLHAWHERARAFRSRTIRVRGRRVRDVLVELDARGYEFVQHVNKYGQPYSRTRRGRRY